MKIRGTARRGLACQALAAGLLAFASLGASWAATPIYKCFDRKSDVVYTDEPCKDGARLDIRAGDADPAALARLERMRDALDRSAAERIRDMRWAAQQPAYALQGRVGLGGEGWPDYATMGWPYDYGPIWGLAGYGVPDFGRNHPRRDGRREGFHSRSVVVARPHMGGPHR